jgi:NCAIR mutase (PurE)-related protein
MSPDLLRRLLEEVAAGKRSVDDAVTGLAALPFAGLEHTLVDHHREIRQGFPETIYGAGKTTAQLIDILRQIHARHSRALATRVGAEAAAGVLTALPEVVYDPVSRLLRLGDLPAPSSTGAPVVLVICAGTSDLPVAEEASQTLEFLGHRVTRVRDAGVAGLHRLLARLDDLRTADVIIAVAGMEGALASVVGGLADCPVIGVPTSVGYGVSAGGHAALNTMLSSCAAGVGVVNIDNGHGAAMLAHQILRRVRPKSSQVNP